MENDTGSWWLFTALEWQYGWVWLSIVGNSYVGYLNFIKNKSHRDSLIKLIKLVPKLVHLEINHLNLQPSREKYIDYFMIIFLLRFIMKIKKKALTAIAGVALLASAVTPTLIASTALVTLGSTNAEAACYGTGSFKTCTDGSSYSTYGNSTYGYNSNTGQTWGSSTYGNTSYGYSYGSGGSTNWSYGYYGGYGSGYSYSN